MASSSCTSFSLPNLQRPPPPFSLLHKSSFLGETTHLMSCISPHHHHHHHHHLQFSYYYRRSGLKMPPTTTSTTTTTTAFCRLKPIAAKFNLFEIMGGRGLCNGEKNLQKELQKKPLQLLVSDEETTTTTTTSSAANYNTKEEENPPLASAAATSSSSSSVLLEVPENAFGKELMGLTGGFPGGEEGLRSFIEKNLPPSPSPSPSSPKKSEGSSSSSLRSRSPKSKPPELPILMPGMIAIVKNPKNPYYMYCGIIQRITDGRAGVLFEGGNWDKIISFKLNELERRDKGPPMVNPKSAVLESQIQKNQD